MNSSFKNIVVLGAGCGGITAAINLSKLFKKHYNIKVHLIYKNPYLTHKTQLYEAAFYNNDTINSVERKFSKKNLIFHCGIVKRIDIENKKVFLNNKVISFIYIVMALEGSSNFYNIKGLRESLIKSQTRFWTGGIRISNPVKDNGFQINVPGRIVVDEYLRSKDFLYAYALGDYDFAINPTTGKPVSTAVHFTFQQDRLVAQNIFNEIYGYQKIPYKPKVWGEFISLNKHLDAGWIALPFSKKLSFIGFLAHLLNLAVKEKLSFLLRKESRNWITY